MTMVTELRPKQRGQTKIHLKLCRLFSPKHRPLKMSRGLGPPTECGHSTQEPLERLPRPMHRRQQRSITPLFVVAVVFGSIGAVCCLIVAPMLWFIVAGTALPAQIVFCAGAAFAFAGFVLWKVYQRSYELRSIASLLNSSRRIKVSERLFDRKPRGSVFPRI